MSSGISVVSYELYTFNGSRWELQTRYTRDEREKAIEEGKRVERDLKFGVRVMREEYKPSDNSNVESVVYKSSDAFVAEVTKRARSAPVARRGGGGGAAGAARPEAVVADAAAGAVAERSPVVRVSSLMGISFLASGFLTLLVALLVVRVMKVDPAIAPMVDLGVFVVSFLAFSLPRMNKVLGDVGSSDAELVPGKQKTRAPVKLTGDKSKDDDAVGDLDKSNDDSVTDDAAEPPADESGSTEEKDAGAKADSDDQKSLLQFLAIILPEIRKVQPQLDAFNMIGIDLMLAGAVDVLGNRSGTDPAERMRMLRTAIEALGTKPETAKSFADKLADYMVEPRYLAMVQAGMTAMEAFVAGDTKFNVGAVFKAWNKPQAAQSQPRIMTIMFTDMVGSTDLTQAVGDQAAQEVVRRHNGIVRAVLAEYAGKEIKHTGDGIMMSFPSAINGVEAAIAIQKSIAAHNSRYTDLSLHVRIGINAGEPIEEEEDLFGGTVQLAARVCAFAGTDQIVCSSVVKDLAGGNKSIVFNSRGSQKLKGFSEPVTLYEVPWGPQAGASQS
jgi:class 3 adenylate cyclase